MNSTLSQFLMVSSALAVASFVYGLTMLLMSLVLTYPVFSATDATLLTFLSPYAIDAGLTESQAVNLLTALAVGGMVFIVPIGWLADHMDRMNCIMPS